MAGRLEKKIALVTGAGCVGPGWGNGRATTVRMIEEGASVFAVDIEPESLEETVQRANAPEGRLRTHRADATDGGSVAAMVEACVGAFGRIDVLVNNVGGSMPGGPVELSEEVFDQQVAFNLKSPFLAMKHVIPVMERQGGGSIVNLASTSGLRWSGHPNVAYAACKAGVIQMSRVTAVQYAAKRIRVNTVVPGLMHTPMVEARLAHHRAGGDAEALLQERQASVPLGFMGDGRDTANAIVYFASDESRFVTGAEIVVDGGMIARCD